ncbi:MAG: hypothetical protein H6970_10860 [Gammaproteobacteria bacterium]|nr:hypothetical protein [Gammaproteobacteria bacterium]MCP5459329.1 hypothetical protein [Gammaproteobacteria bacterium]
MATIQRTFSISAPFPIGLVELRQAADGLDNRLRARRRSKMYWALGLVLLAVVFGIFGWYVLTAMLGIGAFGVFMYAISYKTSRDIEQIREAADTAQRWRWDAHSNSPLYADVDLSCPDKCEPKKTRRSAKKLKKYYRYVPLELKFALADGNLLAFKIITHLKTKANQEVRRAIQVRGRLKLNSARYPAQARRIPSRIGNLSLRCLTVANQEHVCFWGPIDSAIEVEQGITQLYQALTPVA